MRRSGPRQTEATLCLVLLLIVGGAATARVAALPGAGRPGMLAQGQSPVEGPAAAKDPVLRFELPGEAAPAYRTDEMVPPRLAELAEEVHARWPGLSLTSNLSRAADAYVRATTVSRTNDLPPGLLEFVVRWAGCPEPPAVVSILSTTEDGTSDVLDHLGEILARAETAYTLLGVGRVASPRPPFKWRWALILSRRLVEMRPFPGQMEPGQQEVLRFQPAMPVSSGEIVVLRPGGSIVTVPVRRLGVSWAGAVQAGDQPGTLWVQLLVRGPAGQAMVGLLEVAVGQPRALVWTGQRIPDESDIDNAGAAEELMVELVNRDRRRFGLPELQADPMLAAVARAHSRDMVSEGYFGHVSPRFGPVAERLGRSGYRAAVARENISRAITIHESEASLMTSPGHRANLLAVDITRLGVGAVRDRGVGGHEQWVVTQVFAEPLAVLDGGSLRQVVDALIMDRRREAGATPLVASPLLEQWADRIAAAASLSGELDQGQLVAVQQELAVEHSGAPTVRAEMVGFSDPADCRLGDMLAQPELASYGLGIKVSNGTGEAPMSTVVILAATQ